VWCDALMMLMTIRFSCRVTTSVCRGSRSQRPEKPVVAERTPAYAPYLEVRPHSQKKSEPNDVSTL